MSKTPRVTLTSIVPSGDSVPSSTARSATGRQFGRPQPLIAIGFAIVLLLIATTSQGAFATSQWAPLALFTLAVTIGAVIARGGLAIYSRGIRVALGGIWGLAAWSMLSMLWAQSSGNAFSGAGEIVFYAAIVTLPFTLPVSRRAFAVVGWATVAGIGAIAVYILIRLLIHPAPLFLAGRLNGPINYRNATALLFAMPVWPFVIAAATRSNPRALRAGALALATVCTGLAFLTQSRGILLGLAAGGLLALTAGPDRARRTWIAVIVLASIGLGSHWLLSPFHAFDGGDGFVSAHSITVAAQALALLAVVTFAIGLAIALFDQGLRADSPAMRHVHTAIRVVLGVGILAAVVLAAVAIGNPVSFAHRKWDQFRSLNSDTPTTIRYASVGGQRYDLWRVAVKEFESAPLGGVGVDNYQFGYYRDRRTNRNLDDPHSLLFSLLAETGAVGLALMAAFLAGIGVVLASGWRRLGAAERRHVIAPATMGLVLLGQSAVDWMWLIPGLSAIGLFSLAVAAAQVVADREAPDGLPAPARLRALLPGGKTEATTSTDLVTVDSPAASPVRVRRIVRPVGRVLSVGVMTAAALAVLALFLSNAYIIKARSDTATPSAELSAARTAATLDPFSVIPHYLESSALETVGDRAAAYQQLRKALSLEPKNEATLGVLGDFEARGGHVAAARAYYRAALALNPLDTGLQQLAHYGETARRR